MDNRFVPSATGPMAGAAGQRLIRLVGERAGSVRLDLVERRPWDSPADAQQRRGFTIQVQE